MDWIIGIGMMALGIAVVVLLWRNYCLRKEAAQFAGKVEQALDAIVTGKEWKRQGELTDSLWDRIETQLAKAEHVFQRKQEESLREKETVKGLISDISHQTRTPLANMKLYVELLEEETLSGEGTGFLAKLCEQTEKMDFLMQSMVKMSRLETGILQIRKEKQDLSETIRRWGSQIVLAPATVRMRNIMPMLAWQLDAGLTADCTALRMEGEQLIQTRPAFGNSLMADIRSLSEIQMATVRPGTFRPEKQAAKTPDVQTITYTPDERVKLRSFGSFAQGKPLSQAEIIVAGGMGVGSRAGFEKLEALAKKLGGSLGASRTAVEAGFVPYRCQVGMTGITVCPKLYIAVGISGAVQHLAGMSGSGKVVAINSDPKAPIFDYADYGIVGDWEAVVDKLLKEENL